MILLFYHNIKLELGKKSYHIWFFLLIKSSRILELKKKFA